MGADDGSESYRRLPDDTVVSQPGGEPPAPAGTPAGPPPSPPQPDSARRRLRGCLIAAAVVIGLGVLAVAGLVWLVLRPPDFDERARQTVAAEAAAGRATVELGDDRPDAQPGDAQRVAVPLAVCDSAALQRLVAGDGGDGLVLGGRHAPSADREVTVQLTGDGRWKLYADWDGRHRAESLSITAHRDGDRVRLVDTTGETEARVGCG